MVNNLRSSLSGVAFDLGGTKLAAARVERGEVVAREQMQTRGTASTAEQVADMQGLARKVGLQATDRIAMAVAGRVDAEGIWRAVNAETLSNLSDVNLRALGSEVFDRPISVINDAQAATLAEYQFGAGQGLCGWAMYF